eukprot:2553674-Amphidinium_carterae.1
MAFYLHWCVSVYLSPAKLLFSVSDWPFEIGLLVVCILSPVGIVIPWCATATWFWWCNLHALYSKADEVLVEDVRRRYVTASFVIDGLHYFIYIGLRGLGFQPSNQLQFWTELVFWINALFIKGIEIRARIWTRWNRTAENEHEEVEMVEPVGRADCEAIGS